MREREREAACRPSNRSRRRRQEGEESLPREVRDEERGIVGGTKRPSVYEHRKTMNSVTAWPPVPWRAEPRPFPFRPFFLSNFSLNVVPSPDTRDE